MGIGASTRLAGLRVEIRSRLRSLEEGEGIEFEDDKALRRFLDEIEAEVRAEQSDDMQRPTDDTGS